MNGQQQGFHNGFLGSIEPSQQMHQPMLASDACYSNQTINPLHSPEYNQAPVCLSSDEILSSQAALYPLKNRTAEGAAYTMEGLASVQNVATDGATDTMKGLAGGKPSAISNANEIFMTTFLLETRESIHSFPVSVAEFLKSGHLSDQIVLPQEDNQVAANTAIGQMAKTAELVEKTKLENAARLALLLTRLFATRLADIYMGSIQLDDFIIVLKEEFGNENIGSQLSSDSMPIKFILQMNLSSLTKSADRLPLHSDMSAMKLLGTLLYSIFSAGESIPSDFLAQLAPRPQEKASNFASEVEEMFGRSPKSFRGADKSVLSTLFECNVFPTSICHLLSGMIVQNKSVSSFDSFEEVVHDLEQMISQPQIFLHDSTFSQEATTQPLFGQANYGRQEQMNILIEVTNRMKQSSHQSKLGSLNSGVEVVFLSGIAGAGKSHFVQVFGENLGSGWTIIKGKFQRGKEHASARIMSSMFDQLIANVVKMKESGRSSEVALSEKVTKSIIESVGYTRLSFLTDFMPSLSFLFDDLRSLSPEFQPSAEDAEFRLIYSTSKIIEAILKSDPDQFLMICCDDMQWGDKSSLSLISEILVNIGSFKDICSRCIFIGLYRDDEVDDNHPITVVRNYLQMMTNNINTTKVNLPSLSKSDITIMLMAELHLPRRYIIHLADVVHKKTSGHALFVVELLNSLIRDSIITYSPQTRSYIWDHDAINLLQTGDGVAGLIALNLKSLPPNSQRVLQLLSCFGMQTEIALLKYLESFQSGIICSLDTFIEMGILDQAGSILMFTHDMIQQEIYESASLAEREALHLKIGECLGKQALIDKPATIEQMVSGLDELQLADEEFFAGKSMFSSLISIACDQIDCAGPSSISDEGQRTRFAAWNLASGKQAQSQSNSLAALYYFSKGIIFLKPSCWHKNNMSLCLALHKGALKAAFTLGKADSVAQYAKEVESHVTFEDSLEIQPFFLMSLSQSGQHEEAICRGIEILRRLNFDIPVAPTPEAVMEAIIATDNIASNFSMDQLVNLCEKAIDDSVHYAFKIIDAFYSSCYVSSSPFLPLVVCAVMQFSFQHGISHTATGPFATFGALKIFIAQDYDSARKWSTVVRALEQKHESMVKNKLNMVTHAYLFLHVSIDIWFQPPMEIAKNLEMHHRKAMRLGQVHIAMCALGMSCRYKLLGGENLSLFTLSYNDHFRLVAKHSGFVARHMLLDSFLLQELTGKSRDYFSLFDGSICSMNDLQDEAKETKDLALLQCSYVFNVIIEYWKGNFLNAEEHSQIASTMFPACKEPTIYLIYHTLFRALVLFKLHRTSEDNHNERLKSGKEMLDAMEAWAQFSVDVFESKWKLLNAEYYASVKDFDQAVHMYKSSIKAAQDHGNIHELALGHELMGNYYFDHGLPDSTECFKKAYIYYSQWGATAIADKLLHKHDLEVESSADQGVHLQAQKHSREWD